MYFDRWHTSKITKKKIKKKTNLTQNGNLPQNLIYLMIFPSVVDTQQLYTLI